MWGLQEITPFADYAALSATPPTLGKLAQIPRLCGNGYFALRGNGTRWEVCPGESIIRDAGPSSAGYDLTAVGTSYVALASYTIPAGLIGDGEEWEVDCYARNNGVWTSGIDSPRARIASSSVGASSASIGAASQVTRFRGGFSRLGSTLANRAASGDVYTGSGPTDLSIDLSVQQSIDIGFIPGAAGNTMRFRFFCFRRIG